MTPTAISLPDLPGWLHFLIGPGKLIILAAVFALAAIGETRRRKGRDDA
ncbi:MAG: hypothetical protein QOD69_721 [Solirubrobacteraceae bacterium]|jgi:hypothetical protein|nr:hypothetical protein [Solirubrobacteraceae bacterium]